MAADVCDDYGMAWHGHMSPCLHETYHVFQVFLLFSQSTAISCIFEVGWTQHIVQTWVSPAKYQDFIF